MNDKMLVMKLFAGKPRSDL